MTRSAIRMRSFTDVSAADSATDLNRPLDDLASPGMFATFAALQ